MNHCTITTQANHTYRVAAVIPDTSDGLRYRPGDDPDFKEQAERAVYSGVFIAYGKGVEMVVPGREVRQVTYVEAPHPAGGG